MTRRGSHVPIYTPCTVTANERALRVAKETTTTRHRHLHYRLAGVAKPHPFIDGFTLGRYETYREPTELFPLRAQALVTLPFGRICGALGSRPDAGFKWCSGYLWAMLLL